MEWAASSPTTVAGAPGDADAQIAADLALGGVEVTWATQRPSRFLADDVDGRVLSDVATARRRALDEARTDTGGVASLGDIVAVPPVRAARAAGLLHRTEHPGGLAPGALSGQDAALTALGGLDHGLAAAACRGVLAAAGRRGGLGDRQLAPAVLIGAAIDLALTERHRAHHPVYAFGSSRARLEPGPRGKVNTGREEERAWRCQG
ncbi:hypothetical protein GCM10018777_11050 [Streptomyces albogriseolus]|nr:hypothetical protein GCM10018777_11050 [Streptomyces viridodiastaticus]